jgi:hypothetical protein
VAIPISRAVRMTRQAISPRLAIRILENMVIGVRAPLRICRLRVKWSLMQGLLLDVVWLAGGRRIVKPYAR